MPRTPSFIHEHLLIHTVDFLPTPSDPTLDFLIEGFLPAGYLCLLASEPKVGKTCLATAIALAVATGTPFAGLESHRANVLWLALEESPDERAQALAFASPEVRRILSPLSEAWHRPPSSSCPNPSIRQDSDASPPDLTRNPRPILKKGKAKRGKATPPPDSDSIRVNSSTDALDERARLARLLEIPRLFQSYTSEPIDDYNALNHLENTVEELRIRLLVVDPLHAATTGHSLYDGWAARRTLMGLKKLCERTGCAALVLHHTKDNLLRGPRVAESQQLSATASMNMVLSVQSPSPFCEAIGRGDGGEGSLAPPSFLRSKNDGGGGVGDSGFASPVEGEVGQQVSCHPELAKGDRIGSHENHRRHLSLACRGRGLFANRTWHFESENPLHYRQIGPPAQTVPTSAALSASLVDELIIQATEKGRRTASDVARITHLGGSTVRRALQRLYESGVLVIEGYDRNAREFKWSEKTRASRASRASETEEVDENRSAA